MDKKELKSLKKELEKNCISLTKFLISYCGTTNKDIYSMKISHQDISKLMPQLKRVSFESLLDDRDSFYIGNIIPVKDCYGNVVPYVNPKIEHDIIMEFDCEVTEDKKMLDAVISEDLSTYELIKLCKYYKTHNRLKEYRMVCKLLNKNNCAKKYKKKKNNKERKIIYDKY